MRIVSRKSFDKAYVRLSAKQKQSVDEALFLFAESPSDAKLRDHALKGKMKGSRAFSAGFDLRIIYKEEGGFIVVILIDVGSHNPVYR